MSRLSPENKAIVERILLVSPDLREAYLLKEAFYRSWQVKARVRRKRGCKCSSYMPGSRTSLEFASFQNMLRNWEPYILNAFDCRFSNGFTEGVNSTIKVIKRIAYGDKVQ